MAFKLLLFVLLSLSSSIPTISSSTIEDAELALELLDAYALSKQGSLHILMNEQADILRGQASEMMTKATEEIDTQVQSITEKISTLAENTKSGTGANVDTCFSSVQEELESFATELSNTLGECYGHMIMTGNELFYSTWSKVWNEYDIDVECSRTSYLQCSQYETEGCVDAVLENIQAANNSLVRAYDVLETEMVNRVIGMNFPCRQMIAQELVLYPTLILNFVVSCLESVSSNAFNLSC